MKGRASFGDQQAAAWLPSRSSFERSRLWHAMQRWGYDDISELHRASVDMPDWFWREALIDLGIEFSTPWETYCDQSQGYAFPQWFQGGRLNVYENCVERYAKNPKFANKPAVTSECDNGTYRCLTFGALGEEVERVAAGFCALGIGKGDRVGIFMPVIPEAAVALMACAKIGAIGVPAFSGYGAEPLAARLNAAEAVALVTVDGTTRKDKQIAMKSIADEALLSVPSLRHVFMVNNLGLDTEMRSGRDYEWEKIGEGEAMVATEACDPNDPFLIIFTSGTTGAPKGIVHSHVGYLVKSAIDFGYAFDIQSDDCVAWIADMGWMLGPLMIVGCLQFAAQIVFIEGLPNYPSADRLWNIVERHKVTFLGIAPTAARGLRTASNGKRPTADMSTLRAFASTGEAWDEPSWWWLFETIGHKALPILNYTGGTETGGGILSNYTITPQSPASFSGPLLGQDVDVIGLDGKATDEIGELAIHNVWPGMTHAFWQDKNRYLETYWQKFPEVWVHGDLASIDAKGYWHIHGRSDDTLKVSGRRVGPAEIESALVTVPEIAEAAVIGVPDKDKGQRIVAFVTAKNPAISIEVPTTLLTVERLVGKAMRPAAVVIVEALPKTKNGKIMRRAIRFQYLGQSLGDLSALDENTPLSSIPVLDADL